LAQAVFRTFPKVGWALWLTGLPASGKTTIAYQLQQRLWQLHVPVVVLDSDELRPILSIVPRYDEEMRTDFYMRLTLLAELLVRQETNVVIAATANRRAHRHFARTHLPHFAEVWVKCSLAICHDRDPKGLYARALAGEIRNFPGIDCEYEEPIAPDWIIDNSQLTPEEAVDTLLAQFSFLQKDVDGCVGNTGNCVSPAEPSAPGQNVRGDEVVP
jgi:adenylylsulfate kinase